MIGQYVFQKLSALNLGLTNADGSTRIFPNRQVMAEKDYPSIVYSLENYQPDDGMDGPTGIAKIDVKLECNGLTYDTANELGVTVSTALHATRGQWGELTVQGAFVTETGDSEFTDTDMETILYYSKDITIELTYIIPT